MAIWEILSFFEAQKRTGGGPNWTGEAGLGCRKEGVKTRRKGLKRVGKPGKTRRRIGVMRFVLWDFGWVRLPKMYFWWSGGVAWAGCGVGIFVVPIVALLGSSGAWGLSRTGWGWLQVVDFVG